MGERIVLICQVLCFAKESGSKGRRKGRQGEDKEGEVSLTKGAMVARQMDKKKT